MTCDSKQFPHSFISFVSLFFLVARRNWNTLHRILQDEVIFIETLSIFPPLLHFYCLSKYTQYDIHSINIPTQSLHDIVTTFANDATDLC